MDDSGGQGLVFGGKRDKDGGVTEPRCVFCGRDAGDLRLGPRAFICGPCLVTFRRLVGEQPPWLSQPEPPPPSPVPISDLDRQIDEMTSLALGDLVEDRRDLLIARPAHIEMSALDSVRIPSPILALVPGDLAWRHRLLPTQRAGTKLAVTMLDASDGEARVALEQSTGMEIEASEGQDHAIRLALARYYPGSGQAEDNWCTFCRKRRQDVAALAATAYAGICDGCIQGAERASG